MIKNIIFDIGNVLARFRWKEYIKELGYSPEICERMAKATVQSPYWDEVDRGVLSIEEIIQLCAAIEPELTKEIADFFHDRTGLVVEFDYSAELIASLKEKGYNIYLLSNYAGDTYAYAKEHFRFIPLVDGGIISYEINKIKPEPEIYQELLNRYHLNPNECVFLDDLKRNLAGAAAFGIRTIHFTGYDAAVEQLHKICKESEELQQVRGLIFDLDGTLWDTTKEAAKIWNTVAAGFPQITDKVTAEKLKGLYGLPLEEIARKLFPSVPENLAIQIMEECVKVQCPILQETKAELMGDVKGVFQKLKEHYKIFIVSNCRSGYIEAFLSAHNLKELVDGFACPGGTGLLKADNIRLICSQNHLSPQEVVYIGDTQADETAAHEAGLPFVFAAYGFGDSKKYEYCIQNICELTALFSDSFAKMHRDLNKCHVSKS